MPPQTALTGNTSENFSLPCRLHHLCLLSFKAKTALVLFQVLILGLGLHREPRFTR